MINNVFRQEKTFTFLGRGSSLVIVSSRRKRWKKIIINHTLVSCVEAAASSLAVHAQLNILNSDKYYGFPLLYEANWGNDHVNYPSDQIKVNITS